MSKYDNKKNRKRGWWTAGRAVRQSVPVGCGRRLVEARQEMAGRQSVEARLAGSGDRQTGTSFTAEKKN